MWSVDSETGRLTDVLVCPPDHYRWIPANAVARRTLAAGGQAGVARMLNLLREEVERDMALLGVTSIDQISEKHIFRSS